jgi:hypothetical protein
VRLAGLAREGGGNGEHIGSGLGQRAVEMREAQVIAHGQAEPAPGQVGDDASVARLVVLRLAVALAARQLDVEHVDLVEAGDDYALRREQQRAVGDLARGEQDRHRADVQPDAELAREVGKARDRGVGGLRADGREQALAVHLHQGGDFRGLDIGRALPGRLAHQGAGVLDILLDAAASAHLHQADTNCIR